MTTRAVRIKGDWMVDHQIDNLNRARHLDIVVVNGKAYDAGLYGAPIDSGRLSLHGDELTAWGDDISFSPDSGEIDRIGRSVFA